MPATPMATPTATPAAASSATPAPHRSSRWKIFSGGSDSRVTAHVARLDRSPNAMVLHLDNGQAWQQIGRAPFELKEVRASNTAVDAQACRHH
jgi:hypothetical protein